MNVRPYDFRGTKPNRKEAFLLGDSVPKPLGFNAFPPEWLGPLGPAGAAPPCLRALSHSGRWIGARVASLRCPILRPSEVSINQLVCRNDESIRKTLAELSRVR